MGPPGVRPPGVPQDPRAVDGALKGRPAWPTSLQVRLRHPLPPVLVLVLVVLAALAPGADAFRLPQELLPIKGNPVHRLAQLPPDPVEYDRARRCDPKRRPGTVRFIAWMQRNVRGVFWGSYRCEKWGEREASLHAENRAVDWHLNVYVPADRAAARRLIELLLAPDRVGLPHALARRMGVQEIIWDCKSWWSGSEGLGKYSVCYDRKGRRKKKVDKTSAHRDHIHFGMNWPGANKRTSFWRAAR